MISATSSTWLGSHAPRREDCLVAGAAGERECFSMGLAAMVGEVYRYTVDGRRVYSTFVRFRVANFLVPDGEVQRLNKRLRWYYFGTLTAVLIGTRVVLESDAHWIWFLIGAFAVGEIGSPLLTRGLRRVEIAKEDFRPIDRHTGAVKIARATGAPVLRTLLLLTSLLAVGVVWAALATRDWWLLIAAVTMYGAMSATFVWQLRLIKSSDS